MNSTSTSAANQSAEIAEYIADLDFNVVQSYCTAGAIALLLYHYATTLDAEYSYFWAKRRFGIGWALFLVNRYLPLVAYAYQAPWWPVSDEIRGCAATVISQYILEYSQYALWGAISSFRVYALRQNLPLALLVLTLGVFPVVCDVTIATYMRPDIDPDAGCVLDTSRVPLKLYEILDVFAYTTWVLSEVIVVGVTLAATQHRKELSRAIGRGRMSLSAVLFRDGLAYFVTITVLNITQLIVNVISILRPGVVIDYVTTAMTFIAPLTSILLTRFYFHLQETAHPPPDAAALPEPGHPTSSAQGSLSQFDFSFGAIDVGLPPSGACDGASSGWTSSAGSGGRC